jgi:predicted O-methyltransferase YrrM
MAMKQVLKKILPRPVLHAAIEARDSARFAAAPKRDFPAAPLRAANDVALDRIFADEPLAAAWAQDHGAIGGVFGDDDKFGGINPGDRRALYSLICGLKPERVLEVGTHIGASTLYIARALKHAVPHGHVTTVDILDVNDPAAGSWKKVGLKQAPRDFASQLGCLDRITFIAQPAQEFMALGGEGYDFIFLDGDHTPRAVYEEMAAALKILRPGGVILLHDYYPDARPLFPDGNIIAGPFRALARITRENPAIAARPLGRLPWPTKQVSHMTSLALVTRAA